MNVITATLEEKVTHLRAVFSSLRITHAAQIILDDLHKLEEKVIAMLHHAHGQEYVAPPTTTPSFTTVHPTSVASVDAINAANGQSPVPVDVATAAVAATTVASTDETTQ